MKYTLAFFVFGLVSSIPATVYAYDDGCGVDHYLCKDTCISLAESCDSGGTSAGDSKCDPPCGPDQFCGPFFAGRYTCFDNH
jgi:hypothetical protein